MLGDEEIDPTKVDTSRRVDEYDEETQAGLRKVMFERDRKMRGLPTTEEEKNLDALWKAWNQPNSPFAGQDWNPERFGMPYVSEEYMRSRDIL